MNFKQLKLSKEIQQGLNKLGYVKPLEVQGKVIPSLLAGENMIVKSKTGSGKTAGAGRSSADSGKTAAFQAGQENGQRRTEAGDDKTGG